jgi:hypothetical protein
MLGWILWLYSRVHSIMHSSGRKCGCILGVERVVHSMFAFYGGFYGGVWCRMLGWILWLHSRVHSIMHSGGRK